MTTHDHKERLYCYVDETGQDTEGKLFYVVVVILGGERDALSRALRDVEERSGKRSKKWTRATRRQRYVYIEAVLREVLLTRRIYYSVYTNSRAYVDLTTLSVAKAINTHTTGSYAATVLVDGLQRTEEHRFARDLRKLRIAVRKVRGLEDENDVFIRLADALAGLSARNKRLLAQEHQRIGYLLLAMGDSSSSREFLVKPLRVLFNALRMSGQADLRRTAVLIEKAAAISGFLYLCDKG